MFEPDNTIKARRRGPRQDHNIGNAAWAEEDEQKVHGTPIHYHNLWSSPSQRQPLQAAPQRSIEIEEEIDLLDDENLVYKKKEMENCQDVHSNKKSSPSPVPPSGRIDVFNVPSVSSGSMKNVLDVDMDTSSPHFFRYYDMMSSSNPYSYGSMRRYVKLWIVLFVGLLSFGTVVAIVAVRFGSKSHLSIYETKSGNLSVSRSVQSHGYSEEVKDNQFSQSILTSERDLEEAFNEWATFHKREYGSQMEKRKRFQIWKGNHIRAIEKNKKHGPCKKLKRNVFGDNHFKDLSPLEFKQMFLTGYQGSQHDSNTTRNDGKARLDSNPLDKTHPLEIPRYPKVQAAYKMNWNTKGVFDQDMYKEPQSSQISNLQCTWWNLVCYIRWIMNTFSLTSGSREPRYDANSYPSAIDWREMGAVTSIHTQGDCGACWAITAVETIESAYYIKTGNLLDLAETEVIACDDSCQQCNGGWPQNAYEYVVNHQGLPAENDLDFDASWLVELTSFLAGESDLYSQNDIDSYMADTCPADNSNGDHSGDKTEGSSQVQRKRYAAIQGYDYATDRCYCYNDGSGCDCDNQNENRAVRNIASYGPATVCIDASLWQDYTGGILTSASGCSQGFMDMNHCVQVVGYAYTSDSEDNEANDHSSSKSEDGDGNRQGYWIVRNQWATSWGMSGYAWVAMGDNTCGILNDMTQAFME